MQFKIVAIALLTSLSGVTADLHTQLWCVDVSGDTVTPHNTATEVACANYKQRNTGTEQWDTCPDCQSGASGSTAVCNSAGKHLGGDQMTEYCLAAGATRGEK